MTDQENKKPSSSLISSSGDVALREREMLAPVGKNETRGSLLREQKNVNTNVGNRQESILGSWNSKNLKAINLHLKSTHKGIAHNPLMATVAEEYGIAVLKELPGM